LRRADRGAGVRCWMVAVWYRNGNSVLDCETREHESARIVFEHSDMDRKPLMRISGRDREA
jgi:hypothetical protein